MSDEGIISGITPGEPVEVDLDVLGINRGQISDGFHTFDDLYAHRTALFALLCRFRPDLSWRSREHHEGGEEMFQDFFIAGMGLPMGRHIEQVTYHCRLDAWDLFEGVPVLDHAPAWDGHTPQDVVERLNRWWRLNP
jgi:hypothetical protein